MCSVKCWQKGAHWKRVRANCFQCIVFARGLFFIPVYPISVASHTSKATNEESWLSRETKIWRIRAHEFPLHLCISKDFFSLAFQRCLRVRCELLRKSITWHCIWWRIFFLFEINKTNRPVSAAFRFSSSLVGFRMSINKKLHVQLVQKSFELIGRMKKSNGKTEKLFHTVNCKKEWRRFFYEIWYFLRCSHSSTQ